MEPKVRCPRKVVLVTGGTRGIGKGIAEKFLKNNYQVVVCARTEPDKPIFPEFASTCKFFRCDISSAQSRANLVDAIMDLYGRMDVLVNNAGVAPKERRDLLEATEESYEYVMKINLQGPYFLTQRVSKELIRLKQTKIIPDYSPSIINISSISAYASSPMRGEYCVSKAGLSMATKLYADRLAEYDIPVFEVRPGIILTPMTEGVKAKYDGLIGEGLLPVKRWGTPEDVAEAVFVLAEGKIPYATGQVLNIDGGFHLHRLS